MGLGLIVAGVVCLLIGFNFSEASCEWISVCQNDDLQLRCRASPENHRVDCAWGRASCVRWDL